MNGVGRKGGKWLEGDEGKKARGRIGGGMGFIELLCLPLSL